MFPFIVTVATEDEETLDFGVAADTPEEAIVETFTALARLALCARLVDIAIDDAADRLAVGIVAHTFAEIREERARAALLRRLEALGQHYEETGDDDLGDTWAFTDEDP